MIQLTGVASRAAPVVRSRTNFESDRMPPPHERYVATAPMRVDFAGGYTDVAPFTYDEGGAVANVAVDLRTTVELTLGGAGVRLASRELRDELVYQRASEFTYDGRLDLLKAGLNLLPVTGPLRLETSSDGPPGSGLGSSGALGVALAAALAAARRETYDPAELAELAYTAETSEAGIRGGRQDQYAAALGGAHLLLFTGDCTEARRIEAPDSLFEALDAHLVLAYAGESRLSGHVHERVWAAYADGDEKVHAALRGMRKCAHDAARALARSDLVALGAAMQRNWELQRSLADEIETARLAELGAVAERHGVLGGKACGAGGGGCLVFLAENRDRLAGALADAGARVLDVRVARSGVRLETCQEGSR